MIQNEKDSARRHIEQLEKWLRSIIDYELNSAYGNDYLRYTDKAGQKIIKKKILDNITNRIKKEPKRYTRIIDATLTGELKYIICKEELFDLYFKKYFDNLSREDVLKKLTKVEQARNPLFHSNEISETQFYQVLCYSKELTNEMKQYYSKNNLENEFNLPLITKFIEHNNGIEILRNKFLGFTDGTKGVKIFENIFVGEELRFEIEVDPTFERSSYTIFWSINGSFIKRDDTIFDIQIDNSFIGEDVIIVQAYVRYDNKDWFKFDLFGAEYDEKLVIKTNRVFPIPS